jgi:PKD repeat protein
MKRFYTLAIVALLTSPAVFGQGIDDECATTDYTNRMMQSDPQFELNQQQLERETQQYIANMNVAERDSHPTKVIPMVFHILHDYGVENISKEQIEDQIGRLNEDFRKMADDYANIPDTFRGDHADTKIEFRLAQLDPNGNCTDGIVRQQSNKTEMDYPAENAALKAESYWPSNMYVNVWVVRSIGGTINGYAQFPGGNSATDGIVLRHGVVGSIGTGVSSNNGRTLAHELGHLFNLRHVWGDGPCGQDDFVQDTPESDAPNYGCPIGHESCGSLDNFYALMDYSDGSCRKMFTNGQSDRMHASLESGRSGRNNLWSPENRIATGINDDYVAVTCKPRADFYPSKTVGCEGSEIRIDNYSWQGDADSVRWVVYNDSVEYVSTETEPTILFENAGVFNVKLVVSNSAGSDSIERENLILIYPGEGEKSPIAQGMEDENFPDNGWSNLNPDENQMLEITYDAAYTGAASLKWSNPNGSAAGDQGVLMSPVIDLSKSNTPVVTFKVAYARRNGNSGDALKVLISDNCGKSWKQRLNRIGSSLETTSATVSGNFFPDESEWNEIEVSLASVNGVSNALIRFEFTSGGGNNFFIDDINIFDKNPPTGINDLSSFDFNLMPNPTEGNAKIRFNMPEMGAVSLKVFDVLGKEIYSALPESFNAGRNEMEINKEKMGMNAKGIYIIQLSTPFGNKTNRLVVK